MWAGASYAVWVDLLKHIKTKWGVKGNVLYKSGKMRVKDVFCFFKFHKD